MTEENVVLGIISESITKMKNAADHGLIPIYISEAISALKTHDVSKTAAISMLSDAIVTSDTKSQDLLIFIELQKCKCPF